MAALILKRETIKKVFALFKLEHYAAFLDKDEYIIDEKQFVLLFRYPLGKVLDAETFLQLTDEIRPEVLKITETKTSEAANNE